MKILYIGDITGKLGRETVKAELSRIKAEHTIDFTIAQGENVSHGKGLQENHAKELMDAGVDFFTGGNHSLSRPDYLKAAPNAIRPANLSKDAAGKGWMVASTPFGKILIISLQGQIVGMNAGQELANPLHTIDRILEVNKHVARAATIVNFHGDFSSEKVVIGQYLDGKVTAVIGDHWHVPTADAQVLPGGTAHITDVGMTGALDSSLGVKTEVIVQRWLRPDVRTVNEMEESGRRQLCAVVIDVDKSSGLAVSIQQIRYVSPDQI